MKTTIVYAHPWEKSFSRAVLDEVCRAVGDYYLIDLYADGFDPVMSRENLALYGRGGTTDPMVRRYNQILDDTNRIVFIFPIWWYDMPAIMRGFLDKVLLVGSAFHVTRTGLYPIRDIRKTYIFTSSTSPTEDLVNRFGDFISKTMVDATFRMVGFHNAQWKNLGRISELTREERQAHLAEIRRLIEE